MARGRNEICVEWLESKDKGKTNQVNVKHVIGDLGEVEKDSVVTLRFNSHRYQARVVDLLDPKSPEQRRKKRSSVAKKTTKPKASKRQQKPLFLVSGSSTKGQEDSTSVADSARGMEPREIEETPRRALSEIPNTRVSPLPPSPPHSPQFSAPHHSSHTSPKLIHGMIDTPSGHLLSALKMSDGFRCDGIFAASSDLLRTSFTSTWRGWRPLLN